MRETLPKAPRYCNSFAIARLRPGPKSGPHRENASGDNANALQHTHPADILQPPFEPSVVKDAQYEKKRGPLPKVTDRGVHTIALNAPRKRNGGGNSREKNKEGKNEVVKMKALPTDMSELGTQSLGDRTLGCERLEKGLKRGM
jgi:hypothetical protein